MFLLHETLNERFFRATPLGSIDDVALLRGEIAPKGVMPFGWVCGAEDPGDLVWTDMVFPVLVSERGRREMKGLTGWKSHPVTLQGSSNEKYPGYHLLTVTGRCGAIDFSRSLLVQKEYPRGFFPEYRGLFFDEKSWDRSDIFMPLNRTGHIFVTENAKRCIETFLLSNLFFVPLELVQLDKETKEAFERTATES